MQLVTVLLILKATDLAEVDIQAMGRWHSNAFKRYIRIPSFEVP